MEKVFIVIRADLPAGAQATQACHVMCDFSLRFASVARRWNESSNNLVLLQVPDESALGALADRCEASGIEVSRFREPDFAGSLTAIALGPGARRLVSNLPLALKRAA